MHRKLLNTLSTKWNVFRNNKKEKLTDTLHVCLSVCPYICQSTVLPTCVKFLVTEIPTLLTHVGRDMNTKQGKIFSKNLCFENMILMRYLSIRFFWMATFFDVKNFILHFFKLLRIILKFPKCYLKYLHFSPDMFPEFKDEFLFPPILGKFNSLCIISNYM